MLLPYPLDIVYVIDSQEQIRVIMLFIDLCELIYRLFTLLSEAEDALLDVGGQGKIFLFEILFMILILLLFRNSSRMSIHGFCLNGLDKLIPVGLPKDRHI